MGVLNEMFSMEARRDLGDDHFSDGVMIADEQNGGFSKQLGSKSVSSMSESASALFLRAMTLKELNAFKEINDGDGDGKIYDGTPQERPATASGQTQQAQPKKRGVVKKPVSADAQLRAPKPKTIPHPSMASKPSPIQKAREERGTAPVKKKTPGKAVERTNPPSFMHKVKPVAMENSPLHDDARYAVKNTAAQWTPKQASDMAKQYEDLSKEVWDTISVGKDELSDRDKMNRLDDGEKARLRKAKEFDSKASLWAHFAENPDAAKEQSVYEAPEDEPFDDIVELEESEADIGASGPQSWDDIDSYTQDMVMQEWVTNRMTDDDFLDWAGDSIRENIDAEELIKDNIDDLLENADWSNLDVGQRELSDQIESVVKKSIESGLRFGSDMDESDSEKLKAALREASPDWKSGELSDTQVESIIDATNQALMASDPGEVNLPTEDEIADIIEIDGDDAADQIYEQWRRGRAFTDEVQTLIDNEFDSQINEEDIVRPYAESEWEKMDYDEQFSAASALGYAEGDSYGDSSERTSSTLERYGIDDAASFVGAPAGTIVEIDGNEVTVSGSGGFKMIRTISRDSIHADYFKIGDDYKSQGTAIVSQMVKQARQLGFKKIETHAAGYLGDPEYNGYYTWPLMGYDQPVKGLRQESMIKAKWPNVETIQDLFAEPGGRDWWFVHGTSLVNAEFDLSDDSRSMRVMERYINEKRRK